MAYRTDMTAHMSKETAALERAIYGAQAAEDAAADAEGRKPRCIATIRDGKHVYNTDAEATRLTRELADRVGSDGSDDLRVIVDQALADDPNVTIETLAEIVEEARQDAAREAAAG